MHLLKWLYPGMRFKRWLFVFAVGVMFVSLGLGLVFNYKYLDAIEEAIFRTVYLWQGSYDYTAPALAGIAFVAIGAALMLLATRFVIRSVITVLLPDKNERLVDIIYEKRKLGKGPTVTVIGGGHGLSVLLRGIKSATSNVTAVVTVADDGGSSGRLREELGIIPPGDLRNCLVALADTEPLMEKLFQYRFKGSSELAGHSFGNLFIAAMTEVTGDVETALKESSKVRRPMSASMPSWTMAPWCRASRRFRKSTSTSVASSSTRSMHSLSMPRSKHSRRPMPSSSAQALYIRASCRTSSSTVSRMP